MRIQRVDIPESVWRPIAQEVCDAHKPLTIPDMLFKDRQIWAIVPRAIFWEVLKSKLNYSFSAIARITGHHHSCVMFAIRERHLINRTYKDGTLARPMRRHRNTPEILPGTVFGELTVQSRADGPPPTVPATPRMGRPRKGKVGWAKHPYYWCLCSCGTELRVAKRALKGGNKVKCGRRHKSSDAPKSAGRVRQREKEQEHAGI